MKLRLRYTLAVCMLALCALTCKAEVIDTTHNFNDMRKGENKTLTWPNGDYTIGETPLLTYRCYNSATFGANADIIIGISFPSVGGYVTTSPAIEYLKRIQITRTPDNADNLKFYYSTDGSTWTQITTGITVSKYVIEVSMPSRGDYYLKIEAKSKNAFIKQIIYYTEPCNCFELESE